MHGYISNDLDELACHMRRLLADPEEARALGANARRLAEERFGLQRFVHDWNEAFREAFRMKLGVRG